MTTTDPRSKAFFLRMTPADLDMLNGIAEDEQRPYTQVAALLMHAALIGYRESPKGTSLLQYCRWLEHGPRPVYVGRPDYLVFWFPERIAELDRALAGPGL